MKNLILSAFATLIFCSCGSNSSNGGSGSPGVEIPTIPVITENLTISLLAMEGPPDWSTSDEALAISTDLGKTFTKSAPYIYSSLSVFTEVAEGKNIFLAESGFLNGVLTNTIILSQDSGQSYNQIGSLPFSDIKYMNVFDVSGSSIVVVAQHGDFSSILQDIAVSPSLGAKNDWQVVTPQLTDATGYKYNPFQVQISGNNILAYMNSGAGHQVALLLSKDLGATWTEIHPVSDNVLAYDDISISGSEILVSVDHGADYGSGKHELMVSKDLGANFVTITPPLNLNDQNSFAALNSAKIAGNNIVLSLNDSMGNTIIYGSSDLGLTYTDITSKLNMNGIQGTQSLTIK